MTNKERVIQAIDQIAQALPALTRINYDNDEQSKTNARAAALRLRTAAELLDRIGEVPSR